MRPLLLLACGAALVLGALQPETTRWYKGNTHTHTLWSDGDGAPELVASWYREEDYDFLVLSDHNLLSQGERWFPVYQEGAVEGRLTPERVRELQQRFGEESVQLRESAGRQEMRLHTLTELRERFETPGEFLLVQGEEISGSFEKRPIHVNALNLTETIYPAEGDGVSATLNAIFASTQEQAERLGRPILAHVNHPNFGWALSWRDLAELRHERFFEVYNGHPAVRNQGGEGHLSLEDMWDRALTHRLTKTDLGLLYGLATDDAHHYHEQAVGRSNTGRGWVMVRSASLEASALIAAMRRGDFYASNGVTLRRVAVEDSTMTIEVDAEEGVRYTTRFVGTRRATPSAVGEVLSEVEGAQASYPARGDELYVRAVVVSDRPHPNPSAAGDLETAWIQPWIPKVRR